MPFCPSCKREFPGDSTECPDDKTRLVGELPYQTIRSDTTTWVEIASTGTDDEAKLMAGFLEAEGIPAQVENVKFSMEPINFGTMGDIRVYVSAENEHRAMQLVRERNEEYDKLDDDDDTLVTDEGVASIDESAETEEPESK
jgi:formate dehydrogenase assembly factor FdhD